MLPVFRAKNKNNLSYDKFPYHPRTNNLKNQIDKIKNMQCSVAIHSSTSITIFKISAPHIYTASTNAVMAISISAAAVARILTPASQFGYKRPPGMRPM
jgi:hypothetical protein